MVPKLTLNNSIHGAALLAVTAVNALGHVDIVTGRPAASVHTLFRLNSDSLGRADGLAELAGNAAFLAGGIATQGMLTAETGRDGTLLEGVEDGVPVAWKDIRLGHLSRRDVHVDSQVDLRWAEVLLQHNIHAAEQLSHEEVLGGLVDGGLGALIPALGRGQTEAGMRGSRWGGCAGRREREVCGRADGHEGGAAVGDQPRDRSGGSHGWEEGI